MLNPVTLENQIKDALEQFLPPAFEQGAKILIPSSIEIGDEMAKDFGKAISDMLAAPLAEAFASAIDYYVKNISISGTVITSGSPVTQTAPIVPAPTPVTAGVIPNTLKVQ